MRTLAIAQYWQRHVGPVAYACCQLTDGLDQRLRQEGMTLHGCEHPAGSHADASWTQGLVQSFDALILDGYLFDDSYQEGVFRGRSTGLVVDDYHHATHQHADLVLNPNLGADAQAYRHPQRVLAGCRYTLLRDEFLVAVQGGWKRTIHQASDRPIRILVTLGGSDPVNATTVVAQVLNTLDVEGPFETQIVLGPGFRHHAELHQVPGVKEERFQVVSSPPDLAGLYQWADVAICAGGGSNWELSMFGTPRLVLPIADNQREVARQLASCGACLVADYQDSKQLALKITQLVLSPELRQRMMESSQELVDGQGRKRVVEAILQHIRNQDDNGPVTV